ncbi:hypothetical protein SO802_009296, partial [Lithocarpus litseifolius]
MRGSGRGGEVGDTRKLGHPLRKFRVRRVRIVQRVYAKKSKSFHLQLSQASVQDFISSAPTHVVFVFLIQSLIGLIQVEYQSKSLSPFDTHPISMWTSFGAICIYSLGLATKMEPKARSASYSKVLSHVILISGVLSSASLASTLLPRFIIWAILPIMLTYILNKHVYKWLYQEIVKANYHACEILNRFLNMMQRQHLP